MLLVLLFAKSHIAMIKVISTAEDQQFSQQETSSSKSPWREKEKLAVKFLHR